MSALANAAPLLVLLSLVAASTGCAEVEGPGVAGATAQATSTRSMPELPAPGAGVPWGGADATKWRPEAIVANAASEVLNREVRAAGVRDAVVAIPVKLLQSDLFPYGDGQSNAAPVFQGAPGGSRPPLVAVLVRTDDGAVRVTVRFDRALAIQGSGVEVAYAEQGQPTRLVLQGARTASGDLEARWSPPASLGLASALTTAAFVVRPEGWSDAFPVTFQHPVKQARALDAASITFSDGRGLVDRERVATADGASPGGVLAALRGHAFAAPYNQRGTGAVAPYETDDVHGRFPFGRVPFVSSVGRGATWVADELPAGYKAMYQCLGARDPAAEASAAHGGVPSGSGWHEIGDSAETLVNDLEGAPLLVGAGTKSPVAQGAFGGGFAWALSDVVTLRWLRHGEAFVTKRGGFHWFAVPYAHPICAQILVSPQSRSVVDFEP